VVRLAPPGGRVSCPGAPTAAPGEYGF
jgi:hypothetical protein